MAQGQDKAPIELPKDPTTPVITLDFQGGGILRKNQEPHLVIRADGTVTVGDPYGVGSRIETRIPVAEVQALLRFAIRDQHFFDFDDAKVKAAIAEIQKKKGIATRVTGASSTIVRIKTAVKEHEAKYYALSTVANQYKEVKELGQLLAVEQRLSRVKNEAIAGGSAEVVKLLTLANEHLRKEFPDAQPLTPSDLQSARWQGEDTLIVSFFRRGAQPDLFVASTVTRPAKGEVKVFVKAKVK